MYFNAMGWIESASSPTELCGSTLPPLFAEGIREPWMLACCISAIQVRSCTQALIGTGMPARVGAGGPSFLFWLPKILCICIATIGALTSQSGSVLRRYNAPSLFPLRIHGFRKNYRHASVRLGRLSGESCLSRGMLQI